MVNIHFRTGHWLVVHQNKKEDTSHNSAVLMCAISIYNVRQECKLNLSSESKSDYNELFYSPYYYIIVTIGKRIIGMIFSPPKHIICERRLNFSKNLIKPCKKHKHQFVTMSIYSKLTHM